METRDLTRDELLNRLNHTVIEAAAFLVGADAHLSDGHTTAHGVLSQLVYWHEQYVSIARSLLEGRTPELKAGTYDHLNQVARCQFASASMTMLAFNLSCLQKELDAILRKFPDWSDNFPIKQDSEPESVSERLLEIDTQIRYFVHRLKQAQ